LCLKAQLKRFRSHFKADLDTNLLSSHKELFWAMPNLLNVTKKFLCCDGDNPKEEVAMAPRYRVTLTAQERDELEALTRNGKTNAKS